ncbi:MAG TPA: hypothetical protein VGV93_04345 [Acidimicrobiales bacterium]|nr:hypothetical protein [Acidimicrobiales bacterium]
MAASNVRAWDEARKVLDVPGLPVEPKLLPRPDRVKIAAALAKDGWPQRLIGDALGIGQARVSRWLRGDEQTWHQVAGRGASTKPKAPRAPASRPAPPVGIEQWAEDEREADESWWQDKDLDDDEPEPEPAPRARAQPARRRKSQAFGSLTGITAARLAAAGYPLTPQGNVDWTAYKAQQAASSPQEPVSAPPPAPEPIPSAPAMRPPVAAPEARSGPARPAGIPRRAVAAEARLRCGCVIYVPLNLARAGAAVGCTGKHGRTTVAVLTGRYELG